MIGQDASKVFLPWLPRDLPVVKDSRRIHHGPEARVCESEDGTLALFGVGQHQ